MRAPGDRRLEVLEDAHDAGGLGLRPVGGDGHEVDLARHVQAAHEVREEEDRALEHAHEHEFATGVVGGDLLAEGAHAVGELVLLDEDLAELRVAHDRASLRARRSATGGRPIDGRPCDSYGVGVVDGSPQVLLGTSVIVSLMLTVFDAEVGLLSRTT
jgi:hypothetical protein